jgi:hypothetical protein
MRTRISNSTPRVGAPAHKNGLCRLKRMASACIGSPLVMMLQQHNAGHSAAAVVLENHADHTQRQAKCEASSKPGCTGYNVVLEHCYIT